MSGYALSITPVRPSDVPPHETLIDLAKKLIASTHSWKQGKTYYKNVKTSHHPATTPGGAPWHCRVSEHTKDEATFDELWDRLGKDKALNEKEFIPEIDTATKVKEVSPESIIWTLHYVFSPPIAPRVFTVLQLTHLEDSADGARSGMIVSIPIDLSGAGDEALAALETPGAVRGCYVSVEVLTERPDGSTEWRMATSSTPGGSIPTFVVERTMASKIAQDVPHFMTWLKETRK
ncbi:hypothetical protein H0H81_002211 [Sphagnurus paluster]|uniref:DUF3074 domain-containing protein n=1 Tax=Sphagnurus paluster TaxID=117069 RepID=A0A9P7GFP2_9AGAR|nr:hypothetical protein H0H81_002211 [Sphagnurus paluster]